MKRNTGGIKGEHRRNEGGTKEECKGNIRDVQEKY